MKATKLKILTLNVHKGFSHFNLKFILPDLREALRSQSPDLVFLQEVLGDSHLKTAAHHNGSTQSQYEYLADSIWSEYAYGKNAIYTEGHHGNAILSKFPIEVSRYTDISIYRLEQRGILHCRVKIPHWNKSIHCICVHTDLFSFHRKLQFKQIVDYIEHQIDPHAPLILAGDFNDWSDRAEQLLAHPLGLQEAFIQVKGKLAKSFPVFWPLLNLDRIYLRGFNALHAEVLHHKPWSRLSDHAALISEVELI